MRQVSAKYRKFSSVLPEELGNSYLYEELKKNSEVLDHVQDQDLNDLSKLIKKCNVGISLDNFKDDLSVCRRGFLLRNEKLNDKQEIKYYLAHLGICKSVLEYLSKQVIRQMESAAESFSKYSSSRIDRKTKHSSFLEFTRSYQSFHGYVLNLLEVVEDYIFYFNCTCKRLDPSFQSEEETPVPLEIKHYELFQGTRELLLRGNVGRFTPSPLIRSAIEIIVTRIIFDTTNSRRYKRNKIVIQKAFKFTDILDAAQYNDIQFRFGIDIFRRLYSWGSVSTHHALRMDHSEIWFALLMMETVGPAGLIVGKKGEIEDKIDLILDRLIECDRITTEPS